MIAFLTHEPRRARRIEIVRVAGTTRGLRCGIVPGQVFPEVSYGCFPSSRERCPDRAEKAPPIIGGAAFMPAAAYDRGLPTPRILRVCWWPETLVDDFILDERRPGDFGAVGAMRRKLSDNIARNRLHILEDYARASFEFNRAKEQKEVAASCAYRLYLDDSERLASMEVLDPPTLLPLIGEALGAVAALQ